ncbi:MAG: DUF3990 domain-containing protein [Treponema sp.]|nr:DUF3990 domain-containing protein [Treponema sp.]
MKQLEEGMILYHGSYCIVEIPDLNRCAKYKDFGQGFYLTTSKEQAKNFAKITAAKAKARGLIPASEEFGYVSFFRVNDVQELKTFGFKTADKEWLHCIVAHRGNECFLEKQDEMKLFDVVSGKIANDDTNRTIAAYMDNLYGPMGKESVDDYCISLLLPEKLQDQFCFRTDKGVSKLQFLKSEKVALF